MVVLAILAILMGIGVGQLQKLNFARYAAVGQVKTVLRNARESAIASGLPVTVVCDKTESRVYDLAVRPVGQWQFESLDGAAVPTPAPSAAGGKKLPAGGSSPGAFGLDARLLGATVEPVGRLGGALVCLTQGARAEVSVAGLSPWDFVDGFSVECDLKVEKDASAVIFRRGKQFKMSVAPDGSVEMQVGLAESEKERGKGMGTLIVTTPPSVVLPGRWTRVAAVYDRCALTLLVDGVPRGFREASQPVLADPGAFEMGDRNGILGLLDGVKVGLIVSREGQVLPRDVTFGFAPPRAFVRFDGEGRLDPAFHGGSLSIPLAFEGGTKREISVGPYGTVR